MVIILFCKFTARFLLIGRIFEKFSSLKAPFKKDYGIKPNITAEVTTEIVTTANSADEIAAGADCQPGRED